MVRAFDEGEFTFIPAFRAASESQQYGSNSLSVFALSLYLRVENPDEFAAAAITEGSNDKKVDLCLIDENEQSAIIVQSYLAQEWGKEAAPTNKASDLNTAAAWLLSASEDLIPDRLKTKALEVRRGLTNGSIKRLEILYVHNCFESSNVSSELKAVANATRDIASSLTDSLIVSSREIGLREIEELYRARDSEILIEDWIDLPVSEHMEEKGNEWRAILTSIPGNWIRELHRAHGDRLFSANFRDFLGTASRKGNINSQIKKTATDEPNNFWVYNNGVTAITHELDLNSSRIRGISVINGAQTSGALGESSDDAAAATKVLLRIVECRSKTLIKNIIEKNNTQNEIKPADRRSNDQIQKRLGADFAHYKVQYVHRRSAARTPRNAITAAAIAPALCAFHGDPQTALRNAKEIFNDDTTYQKVFRPEIRVEHIFLVSTLSSAIDRVKSNLKEKIETATELEQQQYEVLKFSAAKHFLLYLVGALAEQIMRRRVSDLFEWKCKAEVISPENVSMTNSWITAVTTLLPHVARVVQLRGEAVGFDSPTYDVPRSIEQSRLVASELKALIASLDSVLGNLFDEVRSRTSL